MKLSALLLCDYFSLRSSVKFDRKESGFSLVEVIVVIGIIVVLTAMAWSGFFGMRKSMVLIQNMEALRSNIVNAQRSAMLLERGESETYVKGIVVDLSNLKTDHEYTIYKWCSAGFYFEEFEETALVPSAVLENCDSEGLSPLSGKSDIPFLYDEAVEIDLYSTLLSGAPTVTDVIVFESVNGKVHFYKKISDTQIQPVPGVQFASVSFTLGDLGDRLVITNQSLVFNHTGDDFVDYGCAPNCTGRECGPDGCGGLCGGECNTGYECDENGSCVSGCVPDCKTDVENPCGPDGCGSSCGTCVSPLVCTDGACVCERTCDYKQCGDDGCGGTCGSCPEGMDCLNGRCSDVQVCDPQCAPLSCGVSDGCDGVCTCPIGYICDRYTKSCIPFGVSPI